MSLRGPHCPPWRPRFNVDSVGGSGVRITTLCHFVDDSFLRLEHGYTGKDQVTDNVLSEFYNILPNDNSQVFMSSCGCGMSTPRMVSSGSS